jgi:hypothetical protein
VSGLAKLYDNIVGGFSRSHDIAENRNRFNREVLYKDINFLNPGMKLLEHGMTLEQTQIGAF